MWRLVNYCSKCLLLYSTSRINKWKRCNAYSYINIITNLLRISQRKSRLLFIVAFSRNQKHIFLQYTSYRSNICGTKIYTKRIFDINPNLCDFKKYFILWHFWITFSTKNLPNETFHRTKVESSRRIFVTFLRWTFFGKVFQVKIKS